MSKLYALIIGIDNYAPKSKVNALSGCVNDATNIEGFLEKYYEDLLPNKSAIKKLLNEEATRENIINTFQNHLIENAEPGDTVLFYYAGHGSYTESAEIFKKFDGKEQDETFVCYDSRLPGHYDLADKEMAVLLHRIKKGVHTVVIADSCHSASITRGRLGLTRFYSGRQGERPLDSYMLEGDDFYSTMLKKEDKNFMIPHSSHLVLSGCDRDESSYETDNRRGLFTTKLLDLLTTNQNISYKTLFDSVRISVYKASEQDQRPTIFAFEGFNPNTVFLRSDVLPNARHAIKFEEGAWKIENGVIYGLPSDPEKVKDLQIGIYEGIGAQAKFLHQSGVSKVNLTNAHLANSKDLEPGVIYWGEMLNLPSAIVVNLAGAQATKLAFLKAYQKKPSPYFQFSEDFNEAKYTLKLDKKVTTLVITKTAEMVFSQEGFSKEAIETIKTKIEHVSRWETTATLENKNKDSNLSEALEVKFFEEPKKNKFNEIEIIKDNIRLDYFKKGEDIVRIKRGKHKGKEVAKPLFYKITARNVSDQPLHVSLLFLSASFEIKCYFDSNYLAPNSAWTEIDVGHYLRISDQEANQETDLFKIIISNKPFDSSKFLLAELAKNARTVTHKEDLDLSWEDFEEEEKEDWFAKTITVNLIRKNDDIDKNTIRLDKEGITFEKHNKLKASFAFASVNNKFSRNVEPWTQLANYLKGDGLELLNFAKNSRSANDKTVIELSNISEEATLEKEPLTLTLDQSLSANESIVPVTYDGEFLIPLGYSEQKNGSLKVNINYLPTYEDAARKRKKRSITRAAWFVMLKMVGLVDAVYKIRRVVYQPDGTIDRNTDELQQHINEAKKVLLVTHGIIGDTKPMINNLAFLLANKHYDLILTYDYENLHTSIKDIADKLNKKLDQLGFGVNDGKTLHILAHSMGGLVSRHMIEKIRGGDDMVDHLFMFGTPNGGSPFGEIPEFRNKLIALFSIGMNFGAGLGWIGVAMELANKALVGSKFLTNTLAQMSRKDPSFILELNRNSKKGHAEYTIVAGDINKFKPTNDGRFARFKNKVLLKIGNYASAGKPNDIAVVVTDILAIPKEIAANPHEIACHHMNYFEEGPGLKKLKEVMVGIVED